MIEKCKVARLEFISEEVSDRVISAAFPHVCAVAFEVVDGIGVWFRFHQPVSHSRILSPVNYTWQMISVQNLRKEFGPKVVLKGINLEVGAGEIMAIMGSSGGGKTTLLRCIAGLISPTSGTILVNGVNVGESPNEAMQSMGMVFQSAALFDFMTVKENVLFGVRRRKKLSKSEEDDLAHSYLETVGLEESAHLMPSELSGGMKKRVGIARALALQPKVMLYDEPITGLDPVTAFLIDSLIIKVRDQFEMTSLVVSHDVSSVVRVSDRVAFLDEGELAFLGNPEGFLSSKVPAIEEVVEKSQAREID